MGDVDDDDTEPAPSDELITTAERPSARRGEVAALATTEHYELGAPLGRGGMGLVVEAFDRVIQRDVAIKRLIDPNPPAELEARFLREAHVQGRLDHPSIPPVYELGRDTAGQPFIVMKRLSGTTLAAIIEAIGDGDAAIARQFPRQRLLRALVDVCLAVELAHTRGVIHRDLKPANIMLGEFGEVYVLDWGVAKIVGDSDPATSSSGSVSDSTTQAGAVLGSLAYMAPEQRIGLPDLDGRADVYALGCILFELLAARPMYKRADPDDRRPSREAPAREIPPELDDLCVEATAELEARIATARELADRVQGFLDGDRDLSLRRELARKHLAKATATAALGRGDRTNVEALREAGRALALDPSLVEAADLVGRLMLEPPTELVPAVRASLDEADTRAIRRHARAGSIAYLANLAFVPAAMLIGIRQPVFIAVIAALIISLALVAFDASRAESPRWRWYRWYTIAGNTILVAMFARMFTPFLIAPSIAAMVAMILIVSPMFRGRWAVLVAVMFTLALLVPWLGEVVGWLSPTTTFDSGWFVLRSPIIDMRPVPIAIGLTVFMVTVVTISSTLAAGYARAQHLTEQQLHVQAWRLRQLVPDSP